MTPVRWTETAEQDLEGIVDFIEADRPEAAIHVANRLFELAADLRDQPERGAFVPELLIQGIRQYRQVQSPPYRIIYSIRSGAVIIEAILDSRRNLVAILTERLLR